MALHKWRRRQTKNFGEVWVPFAQIDIQAANGAFQPFIFQIDSGAVISLLRRSAADLLGIQLESGRQIQLDSVGGAETTAHVHELQSRFADNIAYRDPFAIATNEVVPNLLGRLKVFDYLQFDFDGTLDETRIAAPWLDAGQRQIWEFMIATERHVIERWMSTDLLETTRRVAAYFINRSGQIVASAVGLVKLGRCYLGPAVLRSMFELSLQLEYLLNDPAQRAQKYLDFSHITRFRQSKAISDNPTGFISSRIASSPLRARGEPRNKKEYDRVRSQFKVHAKTGRPRHVSNWYCMTILELAEELGRAAEYRIVYTSCCNWAHGDPVSLKQQPNDHPFCNPTSLFLAPLCYHARMLLQVSDIGQLLLTSEQYEGLKTMARDIR